MAAKSFHSRQKYRFALTRVHIYIIGIIILVGIIYLAASAVLSGGTVYHISNPTSIMLPVNGSAYFTLPGDSSEYSVFLKSATSSSATFYISGLPILVRPISSVTLSGTGSANVSSSGGSIANMNIALQSVSSGSATFELSSIATTLGIRPSASISIINPATGQGSAVTTVVTTATTTVSSSGTSSTVTTTTATTTISNVVSAATQQQVMGLVNNTPLGTLLKNFGVIYAKDTLCAPSIYNQTYQTKFGSLPSGPNTFANLAQVTPTSLPWAISKAGTNTFNVTYSTVAPSAQATGSVVVIQINNSTAVINSEKFIGNWAGLNYTLLNAQYNYALGINNNCAADIPYVPGH
ncbi:MAG: hypothetical protein KGH52_02290 [Candidatus Micrarchaeota archaeon]|nr:hypothetical protein [Candidatus Micrarchaeota archaeon]